MSLEELSVKVKKIGNDSFEEGRRLIPEHVISRDSWKDTADSSTLSRKEYTGRGLVIALSSVRPIGV